MQSIAIVDSRWEQALPHIVNLRRDEWLDGAVLRCDEANGWESGTTATELLRVTNVKLRGKIWFFNLVVPPSPQAVTTLSDWLALPQTTLLAATYYYELVKMYGRTDITYDSVGIGRSFQFCPACISDARLLRRSFALPHVTCCPIHHLQLIGNCQCYERGTARRSHSGVSIQALFKVGEYQHLYTLGAAPFTCPACGLGWAEFPHIPADPARLALDQRFLAWYDFFFAQGTPAIIEQTMQRIEHALKKQGRRSIQHLDKTVAPFRMTAPEKTSLGKLVETLVSIGFQPKPLA